MMVIVPNYLSDAIDKRLEELTELHPDVDQDWLKNEMLIQALDHGVSPESISLSKAT